MVGDGHGSDSGALPPPAVTVAFETLMACCLPARWKCRLHNWGETSLVPVCTWTAACDRLHTLPSDELPWSGDGSGLKAAGMEPGRPSKKHFARFRVSGILAHIREKKGWGAASQ